MKNFIMGFFSSLFKKQKNTHCECNVDCGAGVFWTGSGWYKKICPVVLERVVKPFREYPWNQVGINGQVVETDVGMTIWSLKAADGTVTDSGVFKDENASR